ncbi:phosphoglycerate dehydrogenase [Staphylococcus aureus]|uniref:phosphoglycerate dehydrogenase n=1 Tax=Staphylococcus aureus TaxID=1280 RepID=UPI0021141685|nr:phosphoglycerate dehydrogenase [Staphylococcus aureus]MCQ6722809.1 phosphoglycerate dehydrogenase [Staphylococcus aureus]
MKQFNVLVADPISKDGIKALLDHEQFNVDIQTGLSEEALIKIIPSYHALIVRSQTTVTENIINAADSLKVIARAGVGVDNININAATLKGILVINAPDGNTISATEHTLAMLLSMARNIPQAHQSLTNKEWNRNAFKGTELYHKTLGVIGAGRIGLGVAKRAQSFGMKILAFDPYLTDEKAKPSLQIINVARGGIIDEKALIKALDEGQISRAAIDVFEHEPATDSPLVAHDKIIVTPHLGASTVEAQEKVAISVSNEIIEILIDGTVTHAVNAPKMDLSNIDDTVKSFINLSQTVGELAIQLMYNAPSSIKITYGGDLASIDSSLLTRTIITHILKDDLGPEVNIINALMLLNQQQVTLNIENNKAETGFSNYLEVELSNDSDSVKVGASVFTGFGPRIVRINNFSVDLKPNQYQIVSYHNDTPGMVGKTGALLGKYNINIASMTLGRTEAGGDALMILSVDQPVSNNIIDELKQVGEYNQIFTTELTVQS